MNALERLTAYLCSNPGNEHMDGEYAAFAARLLKQHARELAEKIRREADDADVAGSPVTPREIGGMKLAADLINPEVT